MSTTHEPPLPACVERLIVLARGARDGSQEAARQLSFLGELIEFSSGVGALVRIQGLVHDHLLTAGPRERELSGLMGAHWEHIPSWAAL